MPRYDATRNQMVRGGADDDTAYNANGALTVSDGVHALAKTGSLGAFTLRAPTADEEGIRMVIVGRTAFAHTVTITAGLGGKGAAFDVITFGAVGDCIELVADNLVWCPVGAPYGAVIA